MGPWAPCQARRRREGLTAAVTRWSTGPAARALIARAGALRPYQSELIAQQIRRIERSLFDAGVVSERE